MKREKGEQLLDMIGDLPEDMVADAAPTGTCRRKRLVRAVASIAACMICVVGVGIGIWQADVLPESGEEIDRLEESIQHPEAPDIMPIRPWEKLPFGEQYTEFSYAGQCYTTQAVPLDDMDMLGEQLGEVTLRGYDEIKQQPHELQATVCRLVDVSEEFALAVCPPAHEGEDAIPYVFVNTSYRPATLGDMINDLNLEALMSFGWVYGDDGGHVVYEDVPDEVIWEWMLSDRTVENVYDEQMLSQMGYGRRTMSVSVYIPALGYRNISLAVTDLGYLTSNIGSTGKAFYIGTERAEAIRQYIEQHYECVLIETHTAIMEESPAQSSDSHTSSGEVTLPYDPRNP